jgi:hypothetical protein
MRVTWWYVALCLVVPALWGWLATLLFDFFLKKHPQRMGNPDNVTNTEFWNYDI